MLIDDIKSYLANTDYLLDDGMGTWYAFLMQLHFEGGDNIKKTATLLKDMKLENKAYNDLIQSFIKSVSGITLESGDGEDALFTAHLAPVLIESPNKNCTLSESAVSQISTDIFNYQSGRSQLVVLPELLRAEDLPPLHLMQDWLFDGLDKGFDCKVGESEFDSDRYQLRFLTVITKNSLALEHVSFLDDLSAPNVIANTFGPNITIESCHELVSLYVDVSKAIANDIKANNITILTFGDAHSTHYYGRFAVGALTICDQLTNYHQENEIGMIEVGESDDSLICAITTSSNIEILSFPKLDNEVLLSHAQTEALYDAFLETLEMTSGSISETRH
jgi:hypothetical protein